MSNLEQENEIGCVGLCDNCKQEIKDEIEYLRDLLAEDLKEDTKDLIKDIIHGYLCELFGVQEEEAEPYCEECEDEEERLNEALRPPQESSIKTIHVSNLQDLLQALRERE